jgi:DNA topoisomerase-1
VRLDGKRIAQGRDFTQQGELREADFVQLDEARARNLASALEGRSFQVRSVEEKPYSRRPAAPFMTSSLQQEASRKLRYTAQTTMRIAQRLYENGYITYMRTDSTTLAESALTAARDQARELYGAEYVPDAPRRYDRKVKNAQEAHEAIRPAGDRFRTPQAVQRELSRDEFALYDLIWKRTIASQMKDAAGRTVSIRVGATSRDGEEAEFGAAGTVITFRGFLAAYEEGRDDNGAGEAEQRLPALSEGDELTATKLEPQGHSTTPPPRYTEATLVRALEERGIGRPSTYASIIGTILDRGYVFKKGTALVPSFLAFAVVALLERHFTQLVDYDFTARMEDDLDRIAGGDEDRVAWLRRFYFGSDGDEGLHDLVTDQLGEIDAREINTIEIGDGIALRIGRYGPYLERGEDRVSVPDDIAPDELTVEKAQELLERAGGDERALGVNPETGRSVVLRAGRYGPYVAELPPDDDSKEKPRTASLFEGMAAETLTLEEALRLLSLPRSLGTAPDGEEITAQKGRYGPYIQKGKETRSLESEEEIFTITLERALELLSQPKQRRRRGQAQGPLRELGADPGSSKPITVRSGRFGPYVTDGETNASLRRGDDPESVTLERAVELLAERRAKGPGKPRRRARSAS